MPTKVISHHLIVKWIATFYCESNTFRWARHGFDSIEEDKLHAGTGAHHNENQIETATNSDSKKTAKVLAFPARTEVALPMAA